MWIPLVETASHVRAISPGSDSTRDQWGASQAAREKRGSVIEVEHKEVDPPPSDNESMPLEGNTRFAYCLIQRLPSSRRKHTIYNCLIQRLPSYRKKHTIRVLVPDWLAGGSHSERRVYKRGRSTLHIHHWQYTRVGESKISERQ